MGIDQDDDDEFLPDMLSDESEDMDVSDNDDDDSVEQENSTTNNNNKKTNRKKTEKKKYCLCRSSRTDKFMIMCDKCNEWFHGDCVKITQSEAKKMKEYYCLMCRSQAMNSETNRTTKIMDSFDDPLKHRMEDDYSPDDLDNDDDDADFRLLNEKKTHKRKYRKNVSKEKPKKSNQKTTKRGRKKGQSTKAKGKGNRGRKKNVVKKSQHRHGRSKAHSDESGDDSKSILPRQCYGPGCIYAARKGSKYCSDQCGINLADKRIMLILPQRIKEWQSVPTAADERSKRELEEIELEIIRTQEKMKEIEQKKMELDELIFRGKNCVPYTEQEEAEILENENDTGNDTISCVTCAQEVSVKMALKHMERCFNKVESQASFGSNRSTNNTLFCETYNPSNKTYCKRLRVICPEHTKEPRIPDDELCGCPLRSDDDPFEDEVNNFCRLLRKKCNLHYGWEKVRQAVLDLETLEQMYKNDELIKKQNKIRQAMNNRGGLVHLLLHQTRYESNNYHHNDGDDDDETSTINECDGKIID